MKTGPHLRWKIALLVSAAMGIINAGTALGGVIAPPAIAWILTYGSWRWIFFLTGGVGILWTLAWRFLYFVPDPGQDAYHRAPSSSPVPNEAPEHLPPGAL